MPRMKKVLLAMCIVCGATAASAQNFNDYFEDRTLRIDYDFTGDVNKQEISVIRLNAIPRWYGKRQNLAEVPLRATATSPSDRKTVA